LVTVADTVFRQINYSVITRYQAWWSKRSTFFLRTEKTDNLADCGLTGPAKRPILPSFRLEGAECTRITIAPHPGLVDPQPAAWVNIWLVKHRRRLSKIIMIICTTLNITVLSSLYFYGSRLWHEGPYYICNRVSPYPLQIGKRLVCALSYSVSILSSVSFCHYYILIPSPIAKPNTASLRGLMCGKL
jgi:hypothetical protein